MSAGEGPVGRELARMLCRRWPAGYLAQLHVVVPLIAAACLVAFVGGLVMPNERKVELLDDIELPAALERELVALDEEYVQLLEESPSFTDLEELSDAELDRLDQAQTRIAEIEGEAHRAATQAGLRDCARDAEGFGLRFLFDVECEGDSVRSSGTVGLAVAGVLLALIGLVLWTVVVVSMRRLAPAVMRRNRLVPPLLVAALLIGAPPAIYWSVLLSRDTGSMLSLRPVAMDAGGCLAYSLAALLVVANVVVVFNERATELFPRVAVIWGGAFTGGMALTLIGRVDVTGWVVDMATDVPFAAAGGVLLLGVVLGLVCWRTSFRMPALIVAADLAAVLVVGGLFTRPSQPLMWLGQVPILGLVFLPTHRVEVWLRSLLVPRPAQLAATR